MARFDHLWHIISYGAALKTGPGGPQGIASYPWQWLLDLKPITYLRVNPIAARRRVVRDPA